MPLAAAIAGAAVIGGGASVIAANKAAKASKNATAANNALQTNIYNQNAQTLEPYVQGGNAATEQLRRLLGLGDSWTGQSIDGRPAESAAQQQAGAIQAFKDSAPNQFFREEGQRSITTALGNRGLLDSGAAQKALLKYGQDYAMGALGDYQTRLAGLSGQGASAAGALTNTGQNYANAVSQNNSNNAATAGNAALSTAANINGILQSGLSAYTYNQGMKSSYGASGKPPGYGGILGGIY